MAWLLEGSVRKSGDTVRITVQLVRAEDGAWSARFDRRLDDIFTIQHDIAGVIAETLTARRYGTPRHVEDVEAAATRSTLKTVIS